MRNKRDNILYFISSVLVGYTFAIYRCASIENLSDVLIYGFVGFIINAFIMLLAGGVAWWLLDNFINNEKHKEDITTVIRKYSIEKHNIELMVDIIDDNYIDAFKDYIFTVIFITIIVVCIFISAPQLFELVGCSSPIYNDYY